MATVFVLKDVRISSQCGYYVCYYPHDYVPHQAAGFLKMQSPASCSEDGAAASSEDLPNGSFAKLNTFVQPDMSDTVGGTCSTYLFGTYWPPDAVRWMSSVTVDMTSPVGNQSHGVAYGKGAYQTFDTRNSATTGSFSVTPMWETGTYWFDFLGWSEPTGCQFPVASAMVTKTINSMSCKPAWFMDVPPSHINFHGPPNGDIYLAVPPGFPNAFAPAEAAAADLSAALGRHIEALSNWTCAANDPLCIGFLNDHGLRQNDTGCASLDPASYTPDGVWIGTTAVRFIPDWTDAHPDNLRWIIDHEVGHYFGLGNRGNDGSCQVGDSMMTAFPVVGSCYAPTSQIPEGLQYGPTATDLLLVDSTYGNRIRRICGWQ